MKKLTVALAAACAILAAAVSYQTIPTAKNQPKHTAAYQRIEQMLQAFQGGNYKQACDVLAWWMANRFVDRKGCIPIAANYMFPKSGHLQYRMLGETVGRPGKYVVVTAEIVMDDPTTKRDEPAFCVKQWADGKSCTYAGVYTFGVQYVISPEDTLESFGASKKQQYPKHWFVDWVD